MRYHPVHKVMALLGNKAMGSQEYDEKVYLPIGRFGVILVIGRSRSGKSSNVKTLLCQIKNRPILIIDPLGEYPKCLHPNLMSRPLSMGFTNFTVIERPVFKIHEFKSLDWISLGFSSAAAQMLTIIGEQVDKHHDEFETFKQIVDELPTSDKQVIPFKQRWGIEDISVVHAQTHTQMMEKIAWQSSLFWDSNGVDDVGDMQGRFYHPNYAELLDKNNLIVDLGLKKGADLTKAIVYTAIILRQLEPYLRMLKPVIVVEEADKIAPSMDRPGAVFLPSAAMVLSDYSLKLMRDDVVVIYITQDHALMYHELVSSWHWKILGILDPHNRDAEYVKGLQNEFESTSRGQRQFTLLSASNKIKRFVPIECPCEL